MRATPAISSARRPGTSDAAEAALADFDAKVADAQGRSSPTPAWPARAFTMADGWIDGGTVSIRMYTPGSLLGGVAERARPENAWTGEGDPDYGLAQTDVEGLTERSATCTSSTSATTTDGGDAFKDGLAGNAIWSSCRSSWRADVTACPTASGCSAARSRPRAFIDATVATLTA